MRNSRLAISEDRQMINRCAFSPKQSFFQLNFECNKMTVIASYAHYRHHKLEAMDFIAPKKKSISRPLAYINQTQVYTHFKFIRRADKQIYFILNSFRHFFFLIKFFNNNDMANKILISGKEQTKVLVRKKIENKSFLFWLD